MSALVMILLLVLLLVLLLDSGVGWRWQRWSLELLCFVYFYLKLPDFVCFRVYFVMSFVLVFLSKPLVAMWYVLQYYVQQ